MDMYIFMMYIFLYDFFFVINLIFSLFPTQKLNRISLLFTASASQQFENYSLFLKKYQIHEKPKKKFSHQNQIEIFTYYYKLQPLKFFFLCVTGTLLYVMDISVFVFNQKNQKLKKKMDISVSRFV